MRSFACKFEGGRRIGRELPELQDRVRNVKRQRNIGGHVKNGNQVGRALDTIRNIAPDASRSARRAARRMIRIFTSSEISKSDPSLGRNFPPRPPGVPAGQPGCFGSSGLALSSPLEGCSNFAPAALIRKSSASMLPRASASGKSVIFRWTAAIRARHGSSAFNASATSARPGMSRSTVPAC